MDSILQFLAPEIEWKVRTDLPDAQLYRGHEGIRDLMSHFDEVMEHMWFQAHELIPGRRGSGCRSAQLGRARQGQRGRLRRAPRSVGVQLARGQDRASRRVRDEGPSPHGRRAPGRRADFAACLTVSRVRPCLAHAAI
jgi:hypothetical protein